MKLLFGLVCVSILSCIVTGEETCETPSITTNSGTRAFTGPICPGDLIFEDEFNDFDLDTWNHENTLAGGGNWEFQMYGNNRTNSFVEDGILYIRPTLLADETGEEFLYRGTMDLNGGAPADQCTNPSFYGCVRAGNPVNIINPIKSARIRTVHSFSFKYGRVEVNAKTPNGDWLWPAIWMMPRLNAYSTWPASGEIDIMESRGNRNLTIDGNSIASDHIGSTLHFGPNPSLNAYPSANFAQVNETHFSDNFHRYQMEWTPEHMIFSVDDIETGRIEIGAGGFWEHGRFETNAPGVWNPWRHATPAAPFDQEFYFIFNLAVGGVAFFPDNAVNGNGQKPWNNNSPRAASDFWEGRLQWLPTWNLDENNSADASLQVDYVRVWAL